MTKIDQSEVWNVFSHNFFHISVIGIKIVTTAGEVIVIDHSQNDVHTIKATPMYFTLYSSAKIYLIFSVFHKSMKVSLGRGSAIGIKEIDMSLGIENCHPVFSWSLRWICIGDESQDHCRILEESNTSDTYQWFSYLLQQQNRTVKLYWVGNNISFVNDNESREL